MKKIYKAIALVLCAALLVAGSIFGTLAFLTSQTATVTNTFTAGNVAITLEEYVINAETGVKDTVATPVTGMTGIKMVPGRKIQKNPFITVAEGSEACYLFVEVKNGLSDLVDINWTAGEWTQIGTSNIYYYKTTATAASGKIDVFPTVTCKDVTGAYRALTPADTIEITAYAVQAEGFATAQAAWEATFGAPVTPNP